MNRYKNATIIKKANIYFDGQVTSRTVILEDNRRITLGVMQPGSYEFTTQAPECMEVIFGQVEVTLAGETVGTQYGPGESFSVPGSSSFQIKVHTCFDYCCQYED